MITEPIGLNTLAQKTGQQLKSCKNLVCSKSLLSTQCLCNLLRRFILKKKDIWKKQELSSLYLRKKNTCNNKGWDRSVILVIDYSVALSIKYSSNRKKTLAFV